MLSSRPALSDSPEHLRCLPDPTRHNLLFERLGFAEETVAWGDFERLVYPVDTEHEQERRPRRSFSLIQFWIVCRA